MNNRCEILCRPVPITEQKWPEGTVPVISICCITYNHEKFVRECLDGFLLQETTFPVEVLIHDDASTDNTASIVREYEAKYPQLIKPIYQSENQFSKKIKPMWNFNFPRVLGEFIAFCEGDDYWTAPHKLQKQVNFLDQHPDYSICGHRVMHISHDLPECAPCPSPVQKESGTLEDILGWNYLPSPSVVYRTGLVTKMPAGFEQLLQGDWPLWVLLAEKGRIGFINEVMAHYRVHNGGVWMGASLEKRLSSVERATNFIHNHLGNRHPSIRLKTLFDNHLSGAWHYNRQRRYGKARLHLFRAFVCGPSALIRSSEAKQLLQNQARFYLVDNIATPLKKAYYRTRIWAGAKRRKIWRSFSQLIHDFSHRRGS